jgi:uncharacterized membrane protein YhaH (DUF805 family)
MSLEAVYVVVGISTPFILLTIWAVLNAAQKDFGSIGKQAAWMLVAAVPFFGFIIYIIFGLKRGKKPEDVDLPAK